MISFEKVRRDFFIDDCLDTDLPFREDFYSDCYDRIEPPKRSTAGSAGYDIRTPIPFALPPGSSIIIPTGIKIHMNKFNVFLLFTRSSIGIKNGIYLLNGTGVIDSDYADNPDNGGDIILALGNRGKATFRAEPGDKIAQGIILPFYATDADDATAHRSGGIGSTGK